MTAINIRRFTCDRCGNTYEQKLDPRPGQFGAPRALPDYWAIIDWESCYPNRELGSPKHFCRACRDSFISWYRREDEQ